MNKTVLQCLKFGYFPKRRYFHCIKTHFWAPVHLKPGIDQKKPVTSPALAQLRNSGTVQAPRAWPGFNTGPPGLESPTSIVYLFIITMCGVLGCTNRFGYLAPFFGYHHHVYCIFSFILNLSVILSWVDLSWRDWSLSRNWVESLEHFPVSWVELSWRDWSLSRTWVKSLQHFPVSWVELSWPLSARDLSWADSKKIWNAQLW